MTKKSSRPHSKKSWREFEELVTRIEKVLAPQEAIVKSPDRIPDAITNEIREVDASIRYKVGTTEILIIIECRDRKKVQDTLWIEQLHSKQQSLRAAKCIAVSSYGFTKPAIRKANMYGIEIRNVKRISQDTIRSWAPLRTFFYSYTLKNVDPSYGDLDASSLDEEMDKKINSELGSKYKLEDPVLKDLESGKLISIDDYIKSLLNTAFGRMKAEDRVKIETNKELIVSFAGPPEYLVECSLGEKYVIGIAFVIIFHSIFDYSIAPTGAYEYSDENRNLVKGVDFTAVSREGKEEKYTVQADLSTNKRTIAQWDEGE